MASTIVQHEALKSLLAQCRWDEAQAFWLDLTEQFPDQPEFILLLVKDFADIGQTEIAAELASLISPSLKDSGKHLEWLYALKLQSIAKPMDKTVRAEMVEAYRQTYQSEPRLKSILAVAELDQPRIPLPAASAKIDTLLALKGGAYCRHKSWGFGRIKSFDAALNRIVVAFPHNPDHAMQLVYAAESLAPISHDHIDVRKITDLENLKQLAAKDPIALIRIILHSFNRSVTPLQIETTLAGTVISADQWKKWWDNARKLLRRDPHFDLPDKKTDPILLRTAPVSQQDELLQTFRDAPSLAQKIDAGRALLKLSDEINDPDLLLQEFHDGLLDAIHKTPSAKTVDRLEAAFLLEDLLTHQRNPTLTTSPLAGEILGAARNLPDLLEDLSTQAHRRAVADLKRSQPDQLIKNLNRFSARTLDEISDLLEKSADRIARHIYNQTASLEFLYWLCKSVTAPNAPGWLDALPQPALLAAVFNALDMAANRSSTKKIRDLFLNETTLITDLLAQAPTDKIRELARALLASTALEELDRRSLMARLVKEFPFVLELVVTKTVKEQPLVVSRTSFEKRQAELDDIVQKKIPANSREIAQARSYGDLRENFEFKAAKDAQKLLMRRRAELEDLLVRAQPTDFVEVNTDTVQIGTTVTLTDLTSGKPQTYHILGAWDSDTTRGIISYPAALAQAILNKQVADTVETTGETGIVKFRIDRINKVPAEILKSL